MLDIATAAIAASRIVIAGLMAFGCGGSAAAGGVLAPVQAGPAAAASSLAEPVQYRDRGRPGAADSLLRPPERAAPRSLFRPYDYRLGPHYEPPPAVYAPPPAVYRPPSPADRCTPRSKAWYDHCAARYRSFDPNRGTYTAYSGVERPCRCP